EGLKRFPQAAKMGKADKHVPAHGIFAAFVPEPPRFDLILLNGADQVVPKEEVPRPVLIHVGWTYRDADPMIETELGWMSLTAVGQPCTTPTNAAAHFVAPAQRARR